MNEIKITNPDKMIFAKAKITKIDVIEYYIDVANLMLPFVNNRPLAVIRCHGGIENECFFKKHPTNDRDFVQTFMDGDEEYFYISSPEELVFQVQSGTLEFHLWGSRVESLEKPDLMVFDLDPDEKLSLEKLASAVLKVKTLLEELGLKSFLKTSGGKGYHVVVPFDKQKSWKGFYDFARQVALLAENKWPQIFTTNIKKSERKGKIFLDFLRNNRGSTCVAPYSLRARENAPISLPIAWEDLQKIRPNEVTIKNYKKYLNSSWKDFFKVR